MRIAIVTDFMDLASLGGSTRVVLEHSAGLARRGHKVAVLSGSRNRSGSEVLNDVLFCWFHYEPADRFLWHGHPAHDSSRAGRPCHKLVGRLSPLMTPHRHFRRLARKFQPEAIIFHQPLSALSILLHACCPSAARIYNFHSPWPEEFLLDYQYAHGLKVRDEDVTVQAVYSPLSKGVRGLFSQYHGSRRSGMNTPLSPLDRGESARATTWRETNLLSAIGYRLRRRLERMALERCDRVVVLSDYMRGLLGEIHPGRPWQVQVVPGGADTRKFFPVDDRETARARLAMPRGRFVACTVRRLIPRMGISNLIGAVRLLVAEGREILLVIGGTGPLLATLEKEVKDSGLSENVRFLGHVHEEDMRSLYSAADLVCVPTSALEGFGLVIVEALACGAATLGTPVGGIPEILRPLDDRLVLKGTDAPSIAAGTRFWMDNPGELEKVRQRCRKYVCDNYTWDHSVAALERVLTGSGRV